MCQFYCLLDMLVVCFLYIEFEFCFFGGGWIDYEVFKCSYCFWVFDNNDVFECNIIQCGMSYFFLFEVMGVYIGNCYCYVIFCQYSIVFCGLMVLFGYMGFELDLVSVDEEECVGY